MSIADFIIVFASGFAAGLINAIAGGGTLVSFPALIALGVPAVSANVTNTIALVPGYLGGAVVQRHDLATYITRLRPLAVVAAIGGLAGSVLLVNSSDELFGDLVPLLILLACALLGAQEMIKRRIAASRARSAATEPGRSALVLGGIVAASAVYGGYFGAGLGIMLLAVLGVALDDPLPRINALKSTLSLVINLVAAAFFAFSDDVRWDFAAIMAVASVLGGGAGGRIAGRLKPQILRSLVIAFGVCVAAKMLLW